MAERFADSNRPELVPVATAMAFALIARAHWMSRGVSPMTQTWSMLTTPFCRSWRTLSASRGDVVAGRVVVAEGEVVSVEILNTAAFGNVKKAFSSTLGADCFFCDDGSAIAGATCGL